MERKITAIAIETVELADGSLPLLAPMSEVTGGMATQAAAKEPALAKGLTTLRGELVSELVACAHNLRHNAVEQLLNDAATK